MRILQPPWSVLPRTSRAEERIRFNQAQYQHHDECADAIDGLDALVGPALQAEHPGGNDAADPVPVQHDMLECKQGARTQRAELPVAPLIVGQTPKPPSRSRPVL